MVNVKKNLLTVMLCIGFTGVAVAQPTASASQDVTVVVQEVNAISLSSAALSLTINSATAGSGLAAATDNATTYSLTTNGSGKKITGQLDADYASGITLDVLLAAPAGGTPTQQTLSTTAKDLVTGVSNTSASGLSVTYTATATLAAAPNGAGETHTVTFTITN